MQIINIHLFHIVSNLVHESVCVLFTDIQNKGLIYSDMQATSGRKCETCTVSFFVSSC